jgi:hypothetical protein
MKRKMRTKAQSLKKTKSSLRMMTNNWQGQEIKA